MPQYELMYLLGAQVADDQVPTISQSILKFAEDFGGTEVKETQLGKKKLAYPIGKTRNGHYVVVNFTMNGKNVNLFDAKIRTQNQNIIRYILVNLEEYLTRQAKDKKIQSQLKPRIQPKEAEEIKPKTTAITKPKAVSAVLEIDSAELDKKIEEALSEDLTK